MLRALSFLFALAAVLFVHPLLGLAERDDFASAQCCLAQRRVLVLEVGSRATPPCFCVVATERQKQGNHGHFPHGPQGNHGSGSASIAGAS